MALRPPMPYSFAMTCPTRRRGDSLILGLCLVGVVAILGGVYVARERPEPAYPRVRVADRGGAAR